MIAHKISAVTLLITCAFTLECKAQPAVSVSYRNILREGGFEIQLEQLDAQGVVVDLVRQRIENGAIGTVSVNPGTRFNIRVLPDGGGGHVFSNRDPAADYSANGNRPIDLDGKFDPVTGRRIAIGMQIGSKELIAPRMQYGDVDFDETASCIRIRSICPCECRYGLFGRRCRR